MRAKRAQEGTASQKAASWLSRMVASAAAVFLVLALAFIVLPGVSIVCGAAAAAALVAFVVVNFEEVVDQVYFSVAELVCRRTGLDSVVRKMQQHPASVAAHTAGCRRLANATDTSRLRVPVVNSNKMAIVNAGGIDVLVDTLRVHRSNAPVLELACKALASLAKKDEDIKAAIADAGGVQAAAEALREHPECPEVQEHGCRLMRNLAAKVSENKVLIVEHGGIEVVLCAMKTHPGLVRVQEEGSRALANLAAANAANQMSIAAKGGIEVLVAAMALHVADAHLQKAGCQALGNLACDEANKVAIAKNGGIGALIQAMAEHRKDTSVQEEGCWALLNIGWCDSSSAARLSNALFAAGAEVFVRAAVADPHATARTLQWGKLLLAGLKAVKERDFRGSGGARGKPIVPGLELRPLSRSKASSRSARRSASPMDGGGRQQGVDTHSKHIGRTRPPAGPRVQSPGAHLIDSRVSVECHDRSMCGTLDALL
jgi:hypothetical protein